MTIDQGNFSDFSDYSLGSVNKFDFYSGSQITVWIGDIMIDDISSIQWVRTQNKRPIYGYASQQFDTVANGTVLIQGQFSVNFRQRGYLSAILEQIKRLYGKVKDKTAWNNIRHLLSLHLKNGTFGPDTADEIADIGNSPDFAELAKAYEDVIWGGGVPSNTERGDEEDNKRSDQIAPDVMQSREIPNGFNILITYGNLSGSEARTINEQLQSTSKTLTGVHLMGETQVIQVGGQPVQEQYTFIARGTDEYIGTTR